MLMENDSVPSNVKFLAPGSAKELFSKFEKDVAENRVTYDPERVYLLFRGEPEITDLTI
jgi:nucleoid-associated protein YejK